MVDEATKFEATDSAAPVAPAPFALVPVDDLEHTQPAAPSYWWDGVVPAGHVTLLGAHGGVGKGWIALMLAVCVALGMGLFGIATRRGRVAIYSAEDAGDLLRYRLRLVCKGLGVDPADLAGWLFVLDATGADPVLFHEVGSGTRREGSTTPAMAALTAFVSDSRIDLLIVDNASDVYAASEIDRAKVRAFMRALAGLARLRGTGVLLLAHVDKGTARGVTSGADGYSGSTAWNNSSRSRLYLSRDKDGCLLLEHQKHNLGPQRAPLRLVWPQGGIPALEEPVSGIVQAIAARNDLSALLRLVAEFSERGEWVSTATSGPGNAVLTLRHSAGYPAGLRAGEVHELLRGAERRGLLQRVEYLNAQRKPRERWSLTSAGREVAGLAQVAQVAQVARVLATGATGEADCAGAQVPAHRGVGGKECARTGAEERPQQEGGTR
jgi:hypothetical protein